MSRRRMYALRHGEGFGDGRAEAFEASARVWIAWMNAVVADAQHLVPSLEVSPSSDPYVLVEVTRTAEEVVATIDGGPNTLGWLKFMEDEFPQKLCEWLPLWFQADLELGRRDELGFTPEWSWRHLFSAEQRIALRAHPAFRRS